MLRITRNGAYAMFSNAPRHLVGGESVIDRDDVERILVGRRDDRLVVSGSCYRQYQHESLLVAFLNEMHQTRATIRLLVSPLKGHRIAQFLGKSDDVEDVFGRLADGEKRKITSHQFRHWLDTLCKRGGLNDFEVARFFGRKRLRDNRAYDHRTTEERAEEVRQLIREEKVAGAIVDAYKACPIESREEFLCNQVTASLLMPNGGCIHDWGQSPCTLHMNCLAGCDEFYITKGDPRERQALEEYKSVVLAAKNRASEERADGTYGAGNYERHQDKLLSNIEAALKSHADAGVDDGASVAVARSGK